MMSDDVVDFNVGGRIFTVRRSLIDSFPYTMLARSAASVWYKNSTCNKSKNTITNSSNISNNNRNKNHNNNRNNGDEKSTKRMKLNESDDKNSIGNEKSPDEDCNNKDNNTTDQSSSNDPIFIDRDSVRFGYVLDYMRDGGVVDLPVHISKESFIQDLVYYGFDDSTSSMVHYDKINVTVPTYEAVMTIEACHNRYQQKIQQIELEKDFVELAYACFKQFVDKRSINVTFRPNSDGQYICKIAQSLARECNTTTNSTSSTSTTTSTQQQHQNQQHRSSILTGSDRIMYADVDEYRGNGSIHNIDNVEQQQQQQQYNQHQGESSFPLSVSSASSKSKLILFNKCLEDYGLKCASIEYESGYTVTIKLASLSTTRILQNNIETNYATSMAGDGRTVAK